MPASFDTVAPDQACVDLHKKEQVPQEVANWIYNRMSPHTMFIGEIVEVIKK